jgi:hypothetical protein
MNIQSTMPPRLPGETIPTGYPDRQHFLDLRCFELITVKIPNPMIYIYLRSDLLVAFCAFSKKKRRRTMRTILIQDGETDPATDDLAPRRFATSIPPRTGVASPRRGKRIFPKLAAVALALPPIVIAAPSRARVGERLKRLIQLRERAASWIHGMVLTRPRQFYWLLALPSNSHVRPGQ